MELHEETVFNQALDISDSTARVQFLDAACRGRPDLRRQVEYLLQMYMKGAVLEPTDAGPLVSAPVLEAGEKLGESIGPYKLLERLGEGGMGIVYMAEQTQPIRRKVALKVIKAGMDTGQVVARFEAERQALAMMNHPGIAKVLDAGTTESGRPYFVMELVRGVPITEFCDHQKLNLRERLALFATICEAVHHAHQKGIIHRDLKPSNLLVELHDVKAVPKVIDFGIAKATNQQLTSKTLFTNFAQIIGTPMYMSPEQAQLTGLDVDIRSDIYSLGVLLYELLTGTTPITKETFKNIAFDELHRMIREVDPPRASARISTLKAQQLSTLAANQRVDVRRLSQSIQGELDWVVVKALEKDRTRRYQSATEFADDINRFLKGDPVLAHPPSIAYRLNKFARRNRAILVGTACLLLMLATSTAVSTRYAWLAHSAIQRADAQRAEAEKNFNRAKESVDEFYTTVSQDVLLNTPSMQPLRRQLLERALSYYEKFAAERTDDPILKLQIAQAYFRVGEIREEFLEQTKCKAAYQEAFTIRQALVKAEPNNEEFRHALAESYLKWHKPIPSTDASRIEFVEEGLQILQSATADAHRATLAKLYTLLGELRDTRFENKGIPSDLDLAKQAWSQAVSIFESLAKKNPEHTEYQIGLAEVYLLMSENSQKSLGLLRDLSEKLPNNLKVINLLAKAFHKSGMSIEQLKKELPVFEQAVRQNPAIPAFQQAYMAVRWTISMLHLQAKQNDQAMLIQESIVNELSELVQAFSDDKGIKSQLALNRWRLGNLKSQNGDFNASIELFSKALEFYLQVDGHLLALRANVLKDLANAQFEAGMISEAISSKHQAIEIGWKLCDEAPEKLHFFSQTARVQGALGQKLIELGRYEDAILEFGGALSGLMARRFNDGDSTSDKRTFRILSCDLVESVGTCIDAMNPQGVPTAMLHERLSNAEKLPNDNQFVKSLVILDQCLRVATRSDAEQEFVDADRHYARAKGLLIDLTSDDDQVLEVVYHCSVLCAKVEPDSSGKSEKADWHRAFSHASEKALLISRKMAESSIDEDSFKRWCKSIFAHYQHLAWRGAESEARLAVRIARQKPRLLNFIVPFFLLAGYPDEFHAVCTEMVEVGSKWETKDDLPHAVRLCSMDPIPPKAPTTLLQMAETAAKEGPSSADNLLGIIYSRCGMHEHAAQVWLSGSRPDFARAIAEANAGRFDHAREALEKAMAQDTKYTPPYVYVRLANEVERKEALGVVLQDKQAERSLLP